MLNICLIPLLLLPIIILCLSSATAYPDPADSKHHAEKRDQRNPNDESTVLENQFTEYLSRGMFSCAANYVGTLRKMNKMIADAYEEYTRCQNIRNSLDRDEYKAKKRFQSQIAMIEDLLD